MAHAALGGFQRIGTFSLGNSYGSWPMAANDASGNIHLVYRDWDLVGEAGHTTHGAGYYSRNRNTPVKKWDTVTEGAQVQDTWVLPIHGTNNVVFILRLYDGASDGRHRYTVSPDLGVTIPAMADMPQPTGTTWTNATGWAFADFCPSADNTKWYGVAYDPASNIFLLETTDGHTWSKRSTISTAQGNEAGLIRFPDGRIVCAIRHATNTSPGYTCYSDDDGLTWSTSSQPNVNAATVLSNNFCVVSPPRGISVSSDKAVILGRYQSNTGYIWHAQWTIDRNGAYVEGPTKITSFGGPSAGGYFWINKEPEGYTAYGYSDFGTNGGDAQIFKTRVRFVG